MEELTYNTGNHSLIILLEIIFVIQLQISTICDQLFTVKSCNLQNFKTYKCIKNKNSFGGYCKIAIYYGKSEKKIKKSRKNCPKNCKFIHLKEMCTSRSDDSSESLLILIEIVVSILSVCM